MTAQALPRPLAFAIAPVASDADAELVHAAKAGDRDAFSELVNRHQARVFRLAGRFFRRREDVEEAAQETFLTAWRKLDRYSAKAPFEHWLTRVCLNTSLGLLRRQRRTEPLEADPVVVSRPASVGIDAARLLNRLAPADAMVLKLLHAEGWSVAEIADRLGWSQANVKVRAHRARKRLRTWVEKELEQGDRTDA